MYSVLPSFVLGFHGCDKATAESVFAGKSELEFANNDYDWLGHGIYFWENNPARALEFARQAKKYPQISQGKVVTPAVIGAVIYLGHCLNFLDAKYLELLKIGYNVLKEDCASSDLAMPQNTLIDKNGDLMLRYLDCAVIETCHQIQDDLAKKERYSYKFDTTRSVFVEGKQIYLNSGFKDKNHIQICVRNPS